jgi:hypothetical protein
MGQVERFVGKKTNKKKQSQNPHAQLTDRCAGAPDWGMD